MPHHAESPRPLPLKLLLLACAALLACMAATWSLWLGGRFPEAPWFGSLRSTPGWIDRGILGLVVLCAAGAVGTVFSESCRRWRKVLLLTIAAGMTGLMALNQHRCQPWAFHLSLIAVVWALCSEAMAMRLLQWLTCGIYLHSALSKFDHSFLHGLGRQFAEALFQQLNMRGWTEQNAALLPRVAMIFPVGELALALCMFGVLIAHKTSARTSRAYSQLMNVCRYGGILMHLFLISIVGPWGLRHEWGVILWNVYFALQNALLWRTDNGHVPAEQTQGSWIANALVAIAVLAPFGEPWGLWDPWPSWGLYSQRCGRAGLHIREAGVGNLPPELQKYLTPADEGGWRQLLLDRWSLETVRAPLYPQQRFHLAAALDVCDRYLQEQDARLVLLSPANRWTGERRSEIVRTDRFSREQLRRRFRFNALPRIAPP